jgi:hypothetical protein
MRTARYLVASEQMERSGRRLLRLLGILVRRRTSRVKGVVLRKTKRRKKIYMLWLWIMLARTRCILLVIHIQRRHQESESVRMNMLCVIFAVFTFQN